MTGHGDKSRLPPAFGGPADPTFGVVLDHCDGCGAVIGLGEVVFGASINDDDEQTLCRRCGQALWDQIFTSG